MYDRLPCCRRHGGRRCRRTWLRCHRWRWSVGSHGWCRLHCRRDRKTATRWNWWRLARRIDRRATATCGFRRRCGKRPCRHTSLSVPCSRPQPYFSTMSCRSAPGKERTPASSWIVPSQAPVGSEWRHFIICLTH